MLIGGGALIGWQIVGVAQDVWGFAQFVNATTEEDLDKCGQHLADAINRLKKEGLKIREVRHLLFIDEM